MTLIKFEPLQEFDTINSRIQRYFNEFPLFGSQYSDSFSPKIDISEDEKNINVIAEMPGVNKEDLKVVLQDNIITIEGEKKKVEEKKDKNYYRSERTYGSFKRCFTIPVEVDSDNIEAKFENGILNVNIKKLEQKRIKEKVIELN